MKPENQADVLQRLRSIEGHTRGVARMVEGDSNCVAVLNQVKALQGALDKVAILIIEKHFATHWPSTLENVDPEKRGDEILELGKIIVDYQGFSRFENPIDENEILNESTRIRVEIKE